MITIHPGDIAHYTDFSGHRRTVRVLDVHADIKNGRPGFDGVLLHSTNPTDEVNDEVWGYTDQITVVRPAAGGLR